MSDQILKQEILDSARHTGTFDLVNSIINNVQVFRSQSGTSYYEYGTDPNNRSRTLYLATENLATASLAQEFIHEYKHYESADEFNKCWQAAYNMQDIDLAIYLKNLGESKAIASEIINFPSSGKYSYLDFQTIQKSRTEVLSRFPNENSTQYKLDLQLTLIDELVKIPETQREMRESVLSSWNNGAVIKTFPEITPIERLQRIIIEVNGNTVRDELRPIPTIYDAPTPLEQSSADPSKSVEIWIDGEKIVDGYAKVGEGNISTYASNWATTVSYTQEYGNYWGQAWYGVSNWNGVIWDGGSPSHHPLEETPTPEAQFNPDDELFFGKILNKQIEAISLSPSPSPSPSQLPAGEGRTPPSTTSVSNTNLVNAFDHSRLHIDTATSSLISMMASFKAAGDATTPLQFERRENLSSIHFAANI